MVQWVINRNDPFMQHEVLCIITYSPSYLVIVSSTSPQLGMGKVGDFAFQLKTCPALLARRTREWSLSLIPKGSSAHWVYFVKLTQEGIMLGRYDLRDELRCLPPTLLSDAEVYRTLQQWTPIAVSAV